MSTALRAGPCSNSQEPNLAAGRAPSKGSESSPTPISVQFLLEGRHFLQARLPLGGSMAPSSLQATHTVSHLIPAGHSEREKSQQKFLSVSLVLIGSDVLGEYGALIGSALGQINPD